MQALILNREPERVIAWVDRICSWPIRRIIPCHFANDIAATPDDFRQAFSFLLKDEDKDKGDDNAVSRLFRQLFNSNSNSNRRTGKGRGPKPLREDMQFLRDVSEGLTKQNVLFPEAELI